MNEWAPTTKEEIEKLIETQLNECTSAQKEIFEKYRVPPFQAPIIRYNKLEQVFVVAKFNNEVMYYEDVEDGFNFSHLDKEGKIIKHWCNQDELKHALLHWMGQPRKYNDAPSASKEAKN